MYKIIKTAALSAMIGFGALAAVPASAQADGLYLNFGGRHQAGVGFYFGDNGRNYRRHHNRRHFRRGCSVRHALRKARRHGVRHARVTRVNHRVIVVRGRKFHNRMRIRFARAPGCPVIRYR